MKKRKTGLQCLLLGVSILVLTPAQAESADKQELVWSAAMGGDVRWFDWREHQDDKQLLMETGPLAALAGQVQLQYGHVFTRIDVQWGGGWARYNGHLQSGPKYEANAAEEIIDGEWRVGWQESSVSVHAGLMQRDWRRFIAGSDSVSSAEERYRWRLLTLGGECQLPWSLPWQMALAINAGRPVDSEQKVYGGFFDEFALEPGSGGYWRIALPLQGRGDSANFHIEPYYQQQDMARSHSVAVTRGGTPQGLLAYQPASIRREFGVSLLWRFAGHAKAEP